MKKSFKLLLSFVLCGIGFTGTLFAEQDIIVNPTGEILQYYNDGTSTGTIAGVAYLADDQTFTGENTFTKTITSEEIQYNISPSPSTLVEGLTFWNTTDKCLNIVPDASGTILQTGQELWIRVKNNTGVTITNGQVCYLNGIDSGRMTVGLAIATQASTSLATLGFATQDILDGAEGFIAIAGIAHDVDTSGCTPTALIYLSSSVPGGFSETQPPSPNYNISLGNCGLSDASVGTINVHISLGNNTQDVIKIFNGAILEDSTVDVNSDGATITLSLEKAGGDDLSLFFNGKFTFFDASPAATIVLAAGSDTAPTLNYVYIPESTGLLTVNAVGFPTTEQFSPIATVICQSAISAQSDGLLKVHVWTDHLSDSVDQGHLAHVNEWIRNQHATYKQPGIDYTLTPTVGGGVATIVNIAVTSGQVYQLHLHAFPALDTSIKDLYVYNDPAQAYRKMAGLDRSLLTVDSIGGSLNNRYYSVVLWGVASEDTEDCHLFINLPGGSYASQSLSFQDGNNYTNTSVPESYRGSAFLIARITLEDKSAGGTLEVNSITDLREVIPATAGGGSSSPAIQQFSDNAFAVFNVADNTKVIAFDAAGITTATTKTFTMPDSDGVIALASGINGGQTILGGTIASENLILDSNPTATKGSVFIESELDFQRGIKQRGSVMYGEATTNIVLGAASTAGTNGFDHFYMTIGGGNNNTVLREISTISGGSDNTISNIFATIGGGSGNIANGDASTIGGGYLNTIVSDISGTIAGGTSNQTIGSYATVGGGNNNDALNTWTVVGGGNNNTASESYDIVSGGEHNIATGSHAVLSGGRDNQASGQYTTIAGGYLNIVSSGSATIGGGESNFISGIESTIGGGKLNTVSALRCTIAGGRDNAVFSDQATVGGGRNNTASGGSAVVAGGANNRLLLASNYSTISGGISNTIDDSIQSVISGGTGNTILGGTCVIAGGGSNTISAGIYGTISGGRQNETSTTDAVVGGGFNNTVLGNSSTCSGGSTNLLGVSATWATLGGGADNIVNSQYAVLSGGSQNTAGGTASNIGGGLQNTTSSPYVTLSGGSQNTVSGTASSVGGGQYNYTNATYTTIGGGTTNYTAGIYATVGGGFGNSAINDYCTVGGGDENSANGTSATVGGGSTNIALGNSATVGGGTSNYSSATSATVGGGTSNTASGNSSTVGGGSANIASNTSSTVCGGVSNTASGESSTVSGGRNNIVAGDYAWVGGRYADLSATADYTFCFSGATSAQTAITTANAFLIFPNGNGKCGIGTSTPSFPLDVNGDAILRGTLLMPGMKSGTTQVAAGAQATELWFDTDDDNTVKMGV